MDKLFVDSEYQRDVAKSRITDMFANFNEDGLRTLVVSERKNGMYAVIDGQHRLELMKNKNITEVACEIRHNLTRREEAELFPVLNNSKAVAPKSKFRALLFAGCEEQKKIASIISNNGFTIQWGRGRPKLDSNVITTFREIQQIVNVYKHNLLDDTLHVIFQAYNINGVVPTAAKKDQFIRGVADYLHESNQDRDDVIDLLRDTDSHAIYKMAEENGRYSTAKKIREYIENLANKQKRRAA